MNPLLTLRLVGMSRAFWCMGFCVCLLTENLFENTDCGFEPAGNDTKGPKDLPILYLGESGL